MSTPLVYCITAPSWQSMIVVNYGRVVRTNEQTKYMLRWTLFQCFKYADHFGWVIEQVPPHIVAEAQQKIAA